MERIINSVIGLFLFLTLLWLISQIFIPLWLGDLPEPQWLGSA